MKQVLAQNPVEVNSVFRLDDHNAHHIFDVLRTTPKETIRLVWDGDVYLGHIQEKPFVFVFGKEETQPRLVDITLCAALIKQDNFEWMLQKAAELGVSRIVPFEARNGIIHLDDDRKVKKLERWSKILENAANQSNREEYVLLEPIQNIETLKEYQSERNLVAYENEQKIHISEKLQDHPESITIVIGPEGGFTPEEIETLNRAGFHSVSLGSNILRAETAALYALSAIEYSTHLPNEKSS